MTALEHPAAVSVRQHFDVRSLDLYAQRAPRTPGWWWVVAAVVTGVGIGLALRTRVFMDQVWITDHGRVLLEGAGSGSMYMLGDGRSVFFSSALGPLLAEWAFRLTQAPWGFRLLNVLALVALAWASLRLAWAWGAPRWAGLALSLVLLFEPSLWQSTTLGRADAITLAALFLGVLLAQRSAAELLRPGYTAPGASSAPVPAKLWFGLGLGYGLAALAPSLWLTSLVLGPLVAVHWAHTLRRLLAVIPRVARPRLVAAVLGVPVLVLLIGLVLPSLPSAIEARAIRVDADFVVGDLFRLLNAAWQMASTSLALLLPALAISLVLRPWWLAALILLGYLAVLLSGFYPFRVPYLVPYAWTVLVLVSASARSEDASEVLRRLYLLILVVVLLLFLVRLGFARHNEPPLSTPGTWVENLPDGVRVADFSWDFYFLLRQRGLVPVRSFAALPRAEVVGLRRAQPDVVVYTGLAPQSWTLVEDLGGLLEERAYCFAGFSDAQGRIHPSPQPSRAVPTPALWRLGHFRVHGPYAFWQPCPKPADEAGPESEGQ